MMKNILKPVLILEIWLDTSCQIESIFNLPLCILTCLHSSFLLATVVACMLVELGSWWCRIYWLWSLLFVQCGVCLVLFGSYIGCISSILNPPRNCLLFPFSSKQNSKSALLPLHNKQIVHVPWCIFLYSIFYPVAVHTMQSLFFICSPQTSPYIPNMYLCPRFLLK